MMDVEFIFGERTWDDLRGELLARVRSRYRRVPVATAEDAVSVAVVDLLDYWVWLPTSVVEDDPDLTFRGALRHANWKASRYILRELRRPDRTTFTDLRADLDNDEADDSFNEYLDTLMVDHTSEDPAEAAGESDLKRRAGRLLEDLSNADKVKWADGLLGGKTALESAMEVGVDVEAIHKRRQRGIRRLIERAPAYGITP